MTAYNDKSEGLWLSELKAERMRAGLTQVELVEESGVSRGTLVRLETGRRPAQSRTARKLAAALGISIRRLVGEEGSIVPETPLDTGPPEPGAPQMEQDVDRIMVYIRGRTEEEVVEEVRERYRDKILAARAQAASTEDPEQWSLKQED